MNLFLINFLFQRMVKILRFSESDNDIKLYVTKMVDNKLEKIGEFNAPYGNIEFSDRNTLSIKDESDNKLLMSCDLANINMLYGK